MKALMDFSGYRLSHGLWRESSSLHGTWCGAGFSNGPFIDLGGLKGWNLMRFFPILTFPSRPACAIRYKRASQCCCCWLNGWTVMIVNFEKCDGSG